jgi:hypothetical protein
MSKLLLNFFQVFPTLAVNHPAPAISLSNVAYRKQLLNINDWQWRIAISCNSAQSFIQVIGQVFHVSKIIKPMKG